MIQALLALSRCTSTTKQIWQVKAVQSCRIRRYREGYKTQSGTASESAAYSGNQPAPIQCRFGGSSGMQAGFMKINSSPAAAGRAEMPDSLRAGLQSLSGFDLSPVRVRYNSPKPAQVGALAYTQGTEIHLSRGQERHLPHEGWHVVQQMQGRVRPTVQYKKTAINDDAALEREADVMGQRAVNPNAAVTSPVRTCAPPPGSAAPIQLQVDKYRAGAWYSSFDPYTTFWTKKEATDYDRKLRALGRAELKARVPTIYTYTHTKPHNKLSSVPQGPHTVAHRVVLQSLIDSQTVQDVLKIFDDQVLTPDDAEEVVFQDEAPSSGSFVSTIDARLQRFIDDYTDIHDALVLEFKKTSPDMILLKHMTNQLLNMDPYAVYAWKTTAQASKTSLNGKGECLSNPQWSDLYDKPPSSSFRSSDNLESFVNARHDLFDQHF